MADEPPINWRCHERFDSLHNEQGQKTRLAEKPEKKPAYGSNRLHINLRVVTG